MASMAVATPTPMLGLPLSAAGPGDSAGESEAWAGSGGLSAVAPPDSAVDGSSAVLASLAEGPSEAVSPPLLLSGPAVASSSDGDAEGPVAESVGAPLGAVSDGALSLGDAAPDSGALEGDASDLEAAACSGDAVGAFSDLSGDVLGAFDGVEAECFGEAAGVSAANATAAKAVTKRKAAKARARAMVRARELARSIDSRLAGVQGHGVKASVAARTI